MQRTEVLLPTTLVTSLSTLEMHLLFLKSNWEWFSTELNLKCIPPPFFPFNFETSLTRCPRLTFNLTLNSGSSCLSLWVTGIIWAWAASCFAHRRQDTDSQGQDGAYSVAYVCFSLIKFCVIHIHSSLEIKIYFYLCRILVYDLKAVFLIRVCVRVYALCMRVCVHCVLLVAFTFCLKVQDFQQKTY